MDLVRGEYIYTKDKEEFEILCIKRKQSVSERALEFEKISNEWKSKNGIDELYAIIVDKKYSKRKKTFTWKKIHKKLKEYSEWRANALKAHYETFKLEPIPWFQN
jgi:hypothetical protein